MPPFCPQCGIDNPANARFCDQCGAALIPVVPTATPPPIAAQPPTAPMATAIAAPAVPNSSGALVCPQCGTTAIPGEAFCDNCGAPLNAPSRPAVQPAVPAYNASVPAQPAYPAPQPSSYAPPTPPPPSSYAPPAPPAPPVAVWARTVLAPSQLVVVANGAVLSLPNADQAIIGRGDPVSNFFPEIDLNPFGAIDNGVGRRHLRLFVQAGQVFIEDMDSTNGTLLNNQKLTARQPQPLRDGDQISVGKLLLRFAEVKS